MPSNLNIFGAYDSRDFNTGLLTPATTVEQYTQYNVMADLRAFAAEYNAALQELLSAWTDRTTNAQAKFGRSFGGRLQVYGEGGVVEATRTLNNWTVGFPIRRYRDRQIYTEEFMARATLEELEKDVIAAASRDYETTVVEILKAVLLKTNYTFDDGAFPGRDLGSIAVKRLFNNDSDSGEIYIDGAKVAVGSLQHYITSGSGTINETAFSLAYAKLKAVRNTSDVVFAIAEGVEGTVRGFTSFVRLNEDKIVNPNKIYSTVMAPRAIGRLDNAAFSGEVVVMPYQPAGYIFAWDRSKPKPIWIREDPDERFRGFRLVQDETRAPYGEDSLQNKQWERIFGAGIYNRSNGVAVEITADGSYDDPSL